MAHAQTRALGFGALGMAAALLTVALVGVCVTLYPPIAQDMALDKAVRHAALVWRNDGRDAAFEQLKFEVATVCTHKPLDASECVLSEADGGRSVRCEWDTRVDVPFSDLVIPLAFASVVEVGPDGELR